MPVYPDGTLLRAQGDPTVYVVQQGQRHGIPSPQVLTALGYDFSEITLVSAADLTSVPLGATVGFPDGTLLITAGDPTVYVVTAGVLQGFPNPETFLALGFEWGNIIAVPASTINAMPKGAPVTVAPAKASGAALGRLEGWRGSYSRVGTGFQAIVANTLGDFGTGNDGFDAVLAVPASAVDADHAAISELDTALAAADFSEGELAVQTVTPLFAEIGAFIAGGQGFMDGLLSLFGL